jgi:hypothetical protein
LTQHTENKIQLKCVKYFGRFKIWTGEHATPPHNAFLIDLMKARLVTEMNEPKHGRMNNRTVYARTEVSTATAVHQRLKIQA